jgi:hypothetical protein
MDEGLLEDHWAQATELHRGGTYPEVRRLAAPLPAPVRDEVIGHLEGGREKLEIVHANR